MMPPKLISNHSDGFRTPEFGKRIVSNRLVRERIKINIPEEITALHQDRN